MTNSFEYPQAFLLASFLTSYPDKKFRENIALLISEDKLDDYLQNITPNHWEALKSALDSKLESEDIIDDLRSEYIDTFDRGQKVTPLYETEYGRDRAMRKAAELADLSGFYRAFGFDFDEKTANDMPDHISIELEFYGLMLMKEKFLLEKENTEGVEIVRSARIKFLEDHLGRFPEAIVNREGVISHEFYSVVFNWCNDLLNKECEEWNVKVDKLSWIADEREKELMDCGDSVHSKLN